ncbi:DUF4956 domain-containing protein [Streptococcus ovis]|uniref:DUF4956 domain-containing protein n=1 Tax=Streptococcus ovis TaxID=82806 RepID=UPI000365CC00|nr:DUF4956 domain-containing protein [Streptococcus ovis]
MPNIFDSVFQTTTTSVNPLLLLLALVISLVLGLALSWVYRYRTLYTKEFATTLTLLPSLIAFMIFLVNGSLGTGIAVAGVFSLIRFRSATSGSRELLAIFMAMIIGLSVGSGFLLLALLITIFLLTIWFFLDRRLARHTLPSSRYLRMTYHYYTDTQEIINHIFQDFCHHYQLVSLKSNQEQHALTVDYEIHLNSPVDDFELIQSLKTKLHVSDISLSTKAKKKKNL